MRETIRKIILSLFPELESRLHLAQYAVVIAIADAPESDAISDVYRPKYAANVRLLDEHLKIDEAQPELKGVPLAMSGAGMEKGAVGFPKPGTIVEIAFAYGKQSMPFIRGALPYRLSLQSCDSDAVGMQKDYTTYQKADRAGNWNRKTERDITDDSFTYTLKAIEKYEYLSKESKEINGHSKESVSGLKRIVAGAFKFITAGSSHFSSGANTNIISGNDTNLNTGNNLNEFVLADRSSVVEGNRSDSTTGNISSIGKGNRTYTTDGNIDNEAQGYNSMKAPKIYLGSSAENTLKISEEFMQSVISALQVLASHTHSATSVISQGGDVASYATEITAQKARLTPIVK